MQQDSAVPDISDEDLVAYAEHRLDAGRRAQVEGFLACNPDLAARVMQASHQWRRAQAAGVAPRPRGSFARGARWFAACVACAVTGWAVAEGLDEDGPLEGLIAAPEYVEDAVMSQRVTFVRIAMDSQTQTPHLDAGELLRATQIRIPLIPDQWRLLDAQIYPSEEGPSISMLVEAGQGRMLNLFAVRADTAASSRPALATREGKAAAYWEVDGAAYVLSGDGPSGEIMDDAALLARNGLM